MMNAAIPGSEEGGVVFFQTFKVDECPGLDCLRDQHFEEDTRCYLSGQLIHMESAKHQTRKLRKYCYD